MFTGLIDSIGTITGVQQTGQALSISICADTTPYVVKLGDSVAINGVCLTIEKFEQNKLFFTAVHETLSKTTLTDIKVGQRVNLERALRTDDRLGGHFVLGHVDGVGKIVRDNIVGRSTIRTIWVPPQLRIFMAPKGSVAVDGVSLTIAESHEETIAVSLIPFTLGATILGLGRPGDSINLECDVLARYIRHMLTKNAPGSTQEVTSGDGNLLAKMERLGF